MTAPRSGEAHSKAANMLALRAELERRQVALLVGTMPATRFDGATGRFLFGQLALAAQLQRDLDSERMASQCRAIFEAGGHRGLDPFGLSGRFPGFAPGPSRSWSRGRQGLHACPREHRAPLPAWIQP